VDERGRTMTLGAEKRGELETVAESYAIQAVLRRRDSGFTYNNKEIVDSEQARLQTARRNA
jgi:hypothetical protein